MLTVLWQTKTTISFPLEDKHVVNKHHAVVRKSHDAFTQEKCPHVVHFNVQHDWFETNSRHQKHCFEGGKKICGCCGLLRRVICNINDLISTKKYYITLFQKAFCSRGKTNVNSIKKLVFQNYSQCNKIKKFYNNHSSLVIFCQILLC